MKFISSLAVRSPCYVPFNISPYVLGSSSIWTCWILNIEYLLLFSARKHSETKSMFKIRHFQIDELLRTLCTNIFLSSHTFLKFRFSEKATKIWKKSPSQNKFGRFFQTLWPFYLTWISHNSLLEWYLVCNWNSDLVKFIYSEKAKKLADCRESRSSQFQDSKTTQELWFSRSTKDWKLICSR